MAQKTKPISIIAWVVAISAVLDAWAEGEDLAETIMFASVALVLVGYLLEFAR